MTKAFAQGCFFEYQAVMKQHAFIAKKKDDMKNIPVLAGFQSSISLSISSAMPGFMSVISYSVASVCIMGRAVSLNK